MRRPQRLTGDGKKCNVENRGRNSKVSPTKGRVGMGRLVMDGRPARDSFWQSSFPMFGGSFCAEEHVSLNLIPTVPLELGTDHPRRGPLHRRLSGSGRFLSSFDDVKNRGGQSRKGKTPDKAGKCRILPARSTLVGDPAGYLELLQLRLVRAYWGGGERGLMLMARGSMPITSRQSPPNCRCPHTLLLCVVKRRCLVLVQCCTLRWTAVASGL